jgi:hypothetical protein
MKTFFEFKKTVKDHLFFIAFDSTHVYKETTCPCLASKGEFQFKSLNGKPSQIMHLLKSNKLTLSWHDENSDIFRQEIYINSKLIEKTSQQRKK